MKLEARLVGLLLIGLGFAGLGVSYLLWSVGTRLAPPVPLPPGMRPDLVPTLSPFSCVLPLIAVASVLLVLEGMRRVVLPD